MPSVEFEVWCSDCGSGLCHTCTEVRGGINVGPCDKCLESARDESYGQGFEEGREAGIKEME